MASVAQRTNDRVIYVDDGSGYMADVLIELSEGAFDLIMAQGAEQGEGNLKAGPADILLCGLPLADASTKTFLEKVKKNHPRTQRILLDDEASAEDAASLVARGLASAYLYRPWEEGDLMRSLEHVLAVRAALNQEKLLESIQQIDRLPSLPSIYQAFLEAVEAERPVSEMGPILEKDVTLTARLLQIANSAFYGGAQVSSVDQAVMRLGINTVKDVVFTFSLVGELDWTPEQARILEDIFTHSSRVNRFLKDVHRKRAGALPPKELACAGLMHDLGKVIMLQYFPDRYDTILEHQAANPTLTFHESEDALDFSWFEHEKVGAYFLNLWNLPDALVEATLFHHDPSKANPALKDVIESLCLTDELVARLELDPDAEIPELPPERSFGLSESDIAALVDDIRAEIRRA